MSRLITSKLLSSTRPLVFGMIHVPALPGTPNNSMMMNEILKKVRKEANILISNKLDGVIIENMHDLPYSKPPLGPEIVSAMSLVCQEVRCLKEKHNSKALIGVQCLAAGNREALAIAHTTGLDFIRAEGFVYSHVADEGWIDACAAELLRYRSFLRAEHVAVFTDIKKKHSAHSVTSDLTIGEMAKDAHFNCADGLIVTGSATGSAANPEELNNVRRACPIPILIGSGVTRENAKLFDSAHGFIVGSYFKKDGNWRNELSEDRISKFMNHVYNLKRKTFVA